MKRVLSFAALLLLPLAAPAHAGQGAVGGPALSTWQRVSDELKLEDPIPEVADWAFDQLDLPGAELDDYANVSQQTVQLSRNYQMDLKLVDGTEWHVEVQRDANGTMRLISAFPRVRG